METETKSRKPWRLFPIGALLAIGLAVFLLAAACGDDDGDGGGDEETRAEVQALIEELVGYGAADADAFLERVTDDLLEGFFGMTREECRENAEECIGEPGAVERIENISIDGDNASADIYADFGAFTFDLIRVDDVWLLNNIGIVAEDLPEGVTAVDLALSEYSFTFDAEAIPDDGNFAFDAENVGGDQHEIVVVSVPEDLDVEAAINSDEEPEGTEDIAFKGPFSPGDTSAVTFDLPLEPGRYVLLCFLPDAEGTPHAVLGMWSEFTIAAAE